MAVNTAVINTQRVNFCGQHRCGRCGRASGVRAVGGMVFFGVLDGISGPPGFLLRSYLCHKNAEKAGLAALLHACAPAADYCSINSEDSLSGYLVRVQVLCA